MITPQNDMHSFEQYEDVPTVVQILWGLLPDFEQRLLLLRDLCT